MKWAYDLCGAEMIIKDEPIYDATTIVQGELMMLGSTTFTAGADAGIAFVSCGSASATTMTVANGIGICLETKTTADSPSVAAAHNTLGGEVCYAKTIINPFAVYRAEVNSGSTSNAGALAVAAGVSATTVAALTITGAFTDTSQGIGQWIIFTASAGPSYGTIRRVKATGASSGSVDLDVAFTVTPTTADKIVLVASAHSGTSTEPNMLTMDATMIGTDVDHDVTAAGLRIVDNYIDRGDGIRRLTPATHANGSAAAGRMNTIAARVPLKVYQDIMIKDHMYGVDL